MKISVIMNMSILRFYGYIENIGEISVDIFSQISIERKLFKIHRNAWKNSKKWSNKQEYIFLSYFVSVIDIQMIKKKNIGR